jgi:hypothetical protein
MGAIPRDPAAVQALLDAFGTASYGDLQVSTGVGTLLRHKLFSPPRPFATQDLLCSLILSECVYKAVEGGSGTVLRAVNAFRAQFPPGTVPLTSLQLCRRRVAHRYLLAAGDGALYAAFMGTKELRDVAADLGGLGPRVLWEGRDSGDAAAAHGGFLSRAEGVPAEGLLLHALRQGRRLVLCGHSLGGAVAELVTLRLLAAAPTLPGPSRLRCVSFGTPALGNAALAQMVESKGWGAYFSSYALPEDPVPRLLLAAAAQTTGGGADSAAAEALEEELYREEATEEGRSQEEEGQVDLARAPRPRWTLGAAVRAAGSALRFPRLPLPYYSHFGQPLFLNASGVAVTPAEADAAAEVPAAAATGALTRGLLRTHRMPAYRARALAICRRAGWDGSAAVEEAECLPGVVEAVLAHEMQADAAETQLPVLWEPQSPVTPPPSLLACAAARRSALSAQTCTLSVEIVGNGLDACTGALLRLPGAPDVAGRRVGGAAQERSLRALEAALGGARRAKEGQRRLGDECDLEFEFQVPTAALLLLSDAKGLSLSLFSDFGKLEVAVRCVPLTAWLLPLDDGLGESVFCLLEAAARADAAAAAAELSGRRRRKDQPDNVSTLFEESLQVSAQPASWLQRLLHPTSTAPPLRSVLLRGLLVQDASEALGKGAGDPAQRLGQAAELVRWLGEQQQEHRRLIVTDPPWRDLETEEEELLLENELGMGARLRRRLRRAAAAAWRQRRWRGVPPPALIAVIAPGEALDSAVLDAVHALAAAATSAQAATLLAVASPAARDALHRRRLAYSGGLHGRPGAVVPLWPEGNAALLQEALLAHGAARRRRDALALDSVFRARL